MKKALSILLFLSFCLIAKAQDTIRTYYDEDQELLKEIYVRINGKAQGQIKRYSEDGQLIQIGFLKDDQRHGLFVDLDPATGDTIRIVPFLENQRNGLSKSFYPSGQVQ